MDSSRSCISNIRPTGLTPGEAATQINDVTEQAFAHAMTGFRLSDKRSVAPAFRSPCAAYDLSPNLHPDRIAVPARRVTFRSNQCSDRDHRCSAPASSMAAILSYSH